MAKYNIEGVGEVTIPDDATLEEFRAIVREAKAGKVSVMDRVKDVPRQVGGALASLIPGAIRTASEGVMGVGSLVGEDANEMVNPMSLLGNPLYAGVTGGRSLGSDIKGVGRYIDDNPVSNFLSDIGPTLRNPDGSPSFGMQAGEIAGQVGAMLGSGGLTSGGRAASLGISALQQAGDTARDVDAKRAAGMEITPDQARDASIASTLAAPLDLINISRLGKYLPGFAKKDVLKEAMGLADKSKLSMAKEIALSSGGESATELGQQLWANTARREIYNPEQSLTEGAWDNLTAGAGAGGVLELVNQMLARKIGNRVNADLDVKRDEVARGASPTVGQTNQRQIALERNEQGEDTARVVEANKPTFIVDPMPFLDQASRSLWGIPIAQVDAEASMKLLDHITAYREQNQLNDDQLMQYLSPPPLVGPSPNPRDLSMLERSMRPLRESHVDRPMGISGLATPAPPADYVPPPRATSETLPEAPVLPDVPPPPTRPDRYDPIRAIRAELTPEGTVQPVKPMTFREAQAARRAEIDPPPPPPDLLDQVLEATDVPPPPKPLTDEQIRLQREDDFYAQIEAGKDAEYRQSQPVAPSPKKAPTVAAEPITEYDIQDDYERVQRKVSAPPPSPTIAIQQRLSRELFGKNLTQLTKTQVDEVNQKITENQGLEPSQRELAEVKEFADRPYSRDQYRSGLKVARKAFQGNKPMPLPQIAKAAGVAASTAKTMWDHMAARGDLSKPDGPDVGPRYSIDGKWQPGWDWFENRPYVAPRPIPPMPRKLKPQTPASAAAGPEPVAPAPEPPAPEPPPPAPFDAAVAEINAGKMPAFARRITGRINEIKLHGLLSTSVVEDIRTPEGRPVPGSKGYYKQRLITLAMQPDIDSMVNTLDHEAVHAMKEMGLFTEAEWNILSGAFNPMTTLSEEERKAYHDLYNGNQNWIQEEAIARGIQNYTSGKVDMSPQIDDLVGKKVSAIRQLGNIFRDEGINTPRQVMDLFKSGQIGGRYADNARPNDKPVVAGKPEAAKEVSGEGLETFATEDEEAEVGKQSVEADSDPTFTDPPRHSIDPDYARQFHQPITLPLKDRVLKAFSDYSSEFRQQVIDRDAAIEANDLKLGQKPVRSSATAAARFARRSRAMVSAIMDHGPLTYRNGMFEANGQSELSPVSKNGWLTNVVRKGKEQKFWVTANGLRARALAARGIETHITPADMALAEQTYQSDADIRDSIDRMKRFNDQMVDTLTDSGYLTPQMAAQWKADPYTPFYRMSEDGFETKQSTGGASIATIPHVQKIKGGEAPIADPLENLHRNITVLTSIAMNNVAMQRALRDGQQLGVVSQVKEPGKGIVSVYVNGHRRHFKVNDPLLYDVMTSSGVQMDPILKALKLPANILRATVTQTPPFMIRNALRDSMQSWAQGYSDIPFANILTDINKARPGNNTFDQLQRMGIVSNGMMGEGGDVGAAKDMRRLMGDTSKIRQAWGWWQEQVQKSEALNRITVYENVLKRTGDKAQAAYEAMELLNFDRHGSSKVIQAFNALIPFQNARWQGVDVLYRGVTGKGAGDAKLAQRQLIARMAVLTALSAAYVTAAAGMKAWQNAAPEERDSNWFVPIDWLPGVVEGEALKIPIPFELGIITKTLPERIMAYISGTDTGEDVQNFMERAVFETFEINPIPHAAKPAFEAIANYDFFRGRDIESLAARRLEPGYRHDDYTSEVSKAIGKSTNISPLKIDHIVKGYLGSTGTYAMQLTDAMLGDQTKPEVRSSEPHTLPMFGSMFQRPEGAKFLLDFYKMRDTAEQAANTLKNQQKEGEELAPEERNRLRGLAGVESRTRGADARQMSMRKAMDRIQADKHLSAAEKRDAMNLLRRQQVEAARRTVDQVRKSAN